MRHERFLTPVSETDPCGPDLDEIGDEKYMTYFFPAEERVPKSFFDTKKQKLFDRTEIDLKSEVQSIDSLLSRSRDIRLICLEARFQAFGGSISGVADCIQAIASLLGVFWETLHPRPVDPADPARGSAIGSLDDRAKIVLPLHYAPIVRDKKLGPIIYRQYAIATGALKARDDETLLSQTDITDAIGRKENAAQAAAVHQSCVEALAAMASIQAMFHKHGAEDTAPDFGALKEYFEDLRDLVEKSLPSLLADGASGDDGAGVLEAGIDGADASNSISADAAQSGVQAAGAVAISNHRDARAAMAAAEAYFAAYEPSSPALILIHQARMLVGRPLVEAIEMLLPEQAEGAAIMLGAGNKFQIGMALMKAVTNDVAVAGANGAHDEQACETVFETRTRSSAAALIAGVESFFMRAEPSSPIPMLLAKGRTFLDRDFTMILNDLLPKQTGSG